MFLSSLIRDYVLSYIQNKKEKVFPITLSADQHVLLAITLVDAFTCYFFMPKHLFNLRALSVVENMLYEPG